ncbi:MAG: hypothetical protein U1F63_13380 [Chitinivorax sp.]
MNTAIVINLNYEQCGQELCCSYWHLIEDVMESAGFVKNNRMFLSNLPQDEAYEVARWVIGQIDEHSKTNRFSLIQSIRDFYGLDYRQLVNLMTPPKQSIEVDFIDNDAVSYAIN